MAFRCVPDRRAAHHLGLAGIGRGDLIVAAGLANLEEGMKVRPYERD